VRWAQYLLENDPPSAEAVQNRSPNRLRPKSPKTRALAFDPLRGSAPPTHHSDPTPSCRTPRSDIPPMRCGVVNAELPGLDEKNLEVEASGDLLTIKGEKRE